MFRSRIFRPEHTHTKLDSKNGPRLSLDGGSRSRGKRRTTTLQVSLSTTRPRNSSIVLRHRTSLCEAAFADPKFANGLETATVLDFGSGPGCASAGICKSLLLRGAPKLCSG